MTERTETPALPYPHVKVTVTLILPIALGDDARAAPHGRIRDWLRTGQWPDGTLFVESEARLREKPPRKRRTR